MSAAELKALKEETEAKINKLKEMNETGIKYAQKMRIEQEMSKYKDPASKRGVQFIMGCQFDLENLLSLITPLFDEEGALLENKHEEKDIALRAIRDWGIDREKKNRTEREAYAMSNRSRHGWLTEKFFRQDDIFLGEGEERAELTASEKVSRFRAAEAQAKYHLQWTAKSGKFGGRGRGVKRSRWGPPTSSFTSASAAAASSSAEVTRSGGGGNFIPGAAFQPPKLPIQCFKCLQFGHMKRECTQTPAQK